MRFQVLLSLWSVTSCSCIDKIPEVAKTKVSKPKTLVFIKVKTLPSPPKTAHLNTPPRLRHDVGIFAKHRSNVYAMKEDGTIILAVVLLLPPVPCPGDTVFRCESETTLFELPKENTTRNQRLSCIYNTVPEQFVPNIRVCAAHFTEDYFLTLGGE